MQSAERRLTVAASSLLFVRRLPVGETLRRLGSYEVRGDRLILRP